MLRNTNLKEPRMPVFIMVGLFVVTLIAIGFKLLTRRAIKQAAANTEITPVAVIGNNDISDKIPSKKKKRQVIEEDGEQLTLSILTTVTTTLIKGKFGKLKQSTPSKSEITNATATRPTSKLPQEAARPAESTDVPNAVTAELVIAAKVDPIPVVSTVPMPSQPVFEILPSHGSFFAHEFTLFQDSDNYIMPCEKAYNEFLMRK